MQKVIFVTICINNCFVKQIIPLERIDRIIENKNILTEHIWLGYEIDEDLCKQIKSVIYFKDQIQPFGIKEDIETIFTQLISQKG